ncbi:hypothetical protein EYF80_054075 [Liparis tanakae]|uniref:Uncharacterized protein n=1 Tax=Liparis tanakae TaxID=230148 RepID=A0A4Z2F3M5_9TELE|nr:hypothetical protein EYF80_054075 [Liparis tanakae]
MTPRDNKQNNSESRKNSKHSNISQAQRAEAAPEAPSLTEGSDPLLREEMGADNVDFTASLCSGPGASVRGLRHDYKDDCRGAAAQHARHHDDDAGQDQDVGGGGVGLGGEQADVVALQHQGPDAHRHHGHARQLGDGQRGRGQSHMTKSSR